MAERIEVCAVADFPVGEAKSVEAYGDVVAVFNVEGKFFACSNSCPHAGAPLYQGFLTGTTVSCPWHGWRFELDPDGEAPKDGVHRYSVLVEEGVLYLLSPESC